MAATHAPMPPNCRSLRPATLTALARRATRVAPSRSAVAAKVRISDVRAGGLAAALPAALPSARPGAAHGNAFGRNRVRHALELALACMLIVTVLALAMFV